MPSCGRGLQGVRGSVLPRGRALRSDELSAVCGACADDPKPLAVRDMAVLGVLYVWRRLAARRGLRARPGRVDRDAGALRVLGRATKSGWAYGRHGAKGPSRCERSRCGSSRAPTSCASRTPRDETSQVAEGGCVLGGHSNTGQRHLPVKWAVFWHIFRRARRLNESRQPTQGRRPRGAVGPHDPRLLIVSRRSGQRPVVGEERALAQETQSKAADGVRECT